jgi:hypothetical protein
MSLTGCTIPAYSAAELVELARKEEGSDSVGFMLTGIDSDSEDFVKNFLIQILKCSVIKKEIETSVVFDCFERLKVQVNRCPSH